MQSYASCLLPSLLRCCSYLLFLCRSLLVLQLFHCVSLSLFWAFAASFIHCIFCSACQDSFLHVGIVCLNFPTCVWSQFHAGTVCLALLAYNWATACWDSLSILLHAGIVCLASLVYDWVIACWDSLACWDSMSSFLVLWLGNCMLG